MKKRTSEICKNFALAGCTFLLCFLLLEVILRFAGYGKLVIYEPHSRLFWKIKPYQECFTKVGRKPVRINSHGTRGPEFTLQKPPNTIRLLVLGDSKTFGWGLAEEETYCSRLKALLQERLGAGTQVEVINAGVNAWSYPQMAIYFEEYGRKFEPDVVIVGDGNLWTQFSENSSPDFVQQFMSRVRLKNFLRRFATFHYIVEVQLEGVYQKYRTKFIPVDPKTDTLFVEQQQENPHEVFRSAIKRLCLTALTNRIQPVLTFVPLQNEIGQTTNSVQVVKQQLASELQLPFLDLTSQIAARKDSVYLEADPVHLNAEGNAILAEALCEKTVPLLQAPREVTLLPAGSAPR